MESYMRHFLSPFKAIVVEVVVGIRIDPMLIRTTYIATTNIEGRRRIRRLDMKLLIITKQDFLLRAANWDLGERDNKRERRERVMKIEKIAEGTV